MENPVPLATEPCTVHMLRAAIKNLDTLSLLISLLSSLLSLFSYLFACLISYLFSSLPLYIVCCRTTPGGCCGGCRCCRGSAQAVDADLEDDAASTGDREGREEWGGGALVHCRRRKRSDLIRLLNGKERREMFWVLSVL